MKRFTKSKSIVQFVSLVFGVTVFGSVHVVVVVFLSVFNTPEMLFISIKYVANNPPFTVLKKKVIFEVSLAHILSFNTSFNSGFFFITNGHATKFECSCHDCFDWRRMTVAATGDGVYRIFFFFLRWLKVTLLHFGSS